MICNAELTAVLRIDLILAPRFRSDEHTLTTQTGWLHLPQVTALPAPASRSSYRLWRGTSELKQKAKRETGRRNSLVKV